MLRLAVVARAAKCAAPELRTALGVQLSQPAQQISGSRCFSSGQESNVKQINSDAEYQQVLKDAAGTNALSVFDFTASWCGPCRVISPVLDQLSREYGHQVNFYKIDIDNDKPTFMFLRGPKKIATFSGADKRQLENNVINLMSLGA